ncbi:MAG: hypothetical protein RLZZ424_257, partial [Bacteroidota bacterium]
IGGEYQWRREGEPHLFDPETVMLAKVSSFFVLLSKIVPLKYLNELESLLLIGVICASDCTITRKKKKNR